MTDVVGGLRARLIHDSLSDVITYGLGAQGWFDTGRAHQPIKVLHGPHTWDVPVDYNALVIITQTVDNDEIEVGSNLTLDSSTHTVELYAESDSLGLELANDIRDVLRGRLPGTHLGSLPILDFRQATPIPLGYAVVDDVRVQRVVDQVPEAWARHVFTVRIVLHDIYY